MLRLGNLGFIVSKSCRDVMYREVVFLRLLFAAFDGESRTENVMEA